MNIVEYFDPKLAEVENLEKKKAFEENITISP